MTSVTAALKLDLHELVIRQLQWDDAIRDSLRPIWECHFQMMEEISNTKYCP